MVSLMGIYISLKLHPKLKILKFAHLLLVSVVGNLQMYCGYLRANLTLR